MERSVIVTKLEEAIQHYYKHHRQDFEMNSNKLYDNELVELRFENFHNAVSNKPVITKTQTNLLRHSPGKYREDGVYLIAASTLSPNVYIVQGCKEGKIYTL